MQRSTKAIIVLIVLVLVLVAGLSIALIQYGKSREAHVQERDQLREDLRKQQDISDGLVRAASEQVSAGDIRDIVKDEMGGIEDDLERLDARVTTVSRVTGRLAASVSRPTASDSVTLTDGVPELHEDITWMNQDGSQELPVAWARVRPLGNDTTVLGARMRAILGPGSDAAVNAVVSYLSDPDVPIWETGTYPMDFHVTTATAEVGGEGDIQTQYVQIWASEPGSDDRISLAVIQADYAYTDPTAPEFRLWSPHLDGGIVGAVTPLGFTGGGSLGFSIASYGKTEDDNIWRFVRVGIGTDGETGWLEFQPAGYNLGKPLPVVSDVWLYGGLVVGVEGYGAGISLVSTW